MKLYTLGFTKKSAKQFFEVLGKNNIQKLVDIRLNNVSHAVKVEDAIYEDGSVPELLDIVEIECNGFQFNYYQIETHVYDPGYYWSKIGRATIKDVLKIQEST